jgi:hypothetical protein
MGLWYLHQQLLQPSKSLYGVVIIDYGIITTQFIVILDFNPNNSHIYLKRVLGVGVSLCCFCCIINFQLYFLEASERQLVKNHIENGKKHVVGAMMVFSEKKYGRRHHIQRYKKPDRIVLYSLTSLNQNKMCNSWVVD